MAAIEPVVGPFPGLHHQGGGEIGEEAKGEGNSEDGVAPGNEAGGKNGSEEEGEGDGQVVEHDVEVLGVPEGGDHASRVGRKGGLFQRKTNG